MRPGCRPSLAGAGLALIIADLLVTDGRIRPPRRG